MEFSKEKIHQLVDEMTDDEFVELVTFVNFLRYKKAQTTQDETRLRRADAMKRLYDAFAPVREAVEASDMTEEEVDRIIDEAIDDVRKDERKEVQSERIENR